MVTGPPASGKTAQAALLAQRYSVPCVTLDALLAEAASLPAMSVVRCAFLLYKSRRKQRFDWHPQIETTETCELRAKLHASGRGATSRASTSSLRALHRLPGSRARQQGMRLRQRQRQQRYGMLQALLGLWPVCKSV